MTITKSSKVSIGIAASAAVIYAAFVVLQNQVTINTQAISKHDVRDEKLLEIVTGMDKKLAVVVKQLEYLEKPIKYTRRDVKALKQQLTGMNQGPQIASPFHMGPYGSR